MGEDEGEGEGEGEGGGRSVVRDGGGHGGDVGCG